ncbi:MAG: hypothetical protein NC311_07585 [Muribaculaceae bacterium]|nr:hypothetical protein [Muribaculaceae bacterium]
MKSIKFRLNGMMPLMLNNPRTVNPFDEYSKKMKEITAKRKKTDDDLEQLMKLKFLASLYVNSKGEYFIPSEHIANAMTAAAKEKKLGAKFTRSVQVIGDSILKFKDADKTPEQLYELQIYVDIRAVGIMKAKVTTARAIIPEWSLETEVWYDETQLDESDIVTAMEIGGMRYGIGTYRKRYGKFKAEKIK